MTNQLRFINESPITLGTTVLGILLGLFLAAFVTGLVGTTGVTSTLLFLIIAGVVGIGGLFVGRFVTAQLGGTRASEDEIDERDHTDENDGE